MNQTHNPKDAIGETKLATHLVSPIVRAYQAIAHFLGNVKYGAWNYRGAGVRSSIYVGALQRHIDAWVEGEEDDPADGTPHLANALACIGILIDAKHAGTLVDDRPPSLHKELAKVRARFEALMPAIKAKHADKNPRHYTIADTKGEPTVSPPPTLPPKYIGDFDRERFIRELERDRLDRDQLERANSIFERANSIFPNKAVTTPWPTLDTGLPASGISALLARHDEAEAQAYGANVMHLQALCGKLHGEFISSIPRFEHLPQDARFVGKDELAGLSYYVSGGSLYITDSEGGSID